MTKYDLNEYPLIDFNYSETETYRGYLIGTFEYMLEIYYVMLVPNINYQDELYLHDGVFGRLRIIYKSPFHNIFNRNHFFTTSSDIKLIQGENYDNFLR